VATGEPAGARTRVTRHPERGCYDRRAVDAILDASFHGHLAFVAGGQPFAMPMLHVRNGEEIYLHGSVKSRFARIAGSGAALCYTVTLLDGLVLARAAFTHSVNYRSAMVLGTGRVLEEPEEKLRAMELLVDHVVPGRTADARAPSPNELKATEIIALQIDEVSAKARSGGPVDSKQDMDMPIWAGVLPVRLSAGKPVADGEPGAPVPGYVHSWRAGGEAAP
jgi:nitroimidazol reductase NimA-like FMN-containing flavoprotein (pyridoxamine 5'-phosphate oxidase superfamily)